MIDFNVVLGDPRQRSVAYAVCYLRSEVAQRGLRILVGSDDEVKLYLNGKQVHQYLVGRAFIEDQDTVPGLAVNAVLNVLVFKVVNEFVDWKGSIRFTAKPATPAFVTRIGTRRISTRLHF